MISVLFCAIARSGERRAELSGGWPLCQGHGPPFHQLYTPDLHRLPAAAWIPLHWSLWPLPWPTLTSDPGFWLTWAVCASVTARLGRGLPTSGPAVCSPGMWTYVVLRPATFMRGELSLARCLLPPISPIKNILPSRSARSSPGPQLYFINTFRQVQKGMIHAGPERS